MEREAGLPLFVDHPRQVQAGLGHRLDKIDWNFLERTLTSPLEAIHPYPAKFIGDIPRSLIEQIGLPPGTAVLDPFCGSGTTLVEAQRLGYPSVGIDLNPIACLLSRIKTSALPGQIQSIWPKIVATARQTAATTVLNIPNLDHWFADDVREALAALLTAIEKLSPPSCLDFLRAALSSIIVRVSNQESDTRYAAVTKQIRRDDVFDEFSLSCAKLHKALLHRNYTLSPAIVLEKDILAAKPSEITLPIGLIVTSPPYPNAYEYWLYHKYRMWWLGFDPIDVRSKEIGARPHYFKKNHQTELDFARQMETALKLMVAVLAPTGHICILVGRSKIHGRIIDNALLLRTAAQRQGLKLLDQRERVIQATRKSFNLSHANIKTETLLVFGKA